jgi:hypothetical protein
MTGSYVWLRTTANQVVLMEDTTPSTSHMVEDRPRRAKQRRLDQQSTTSEDPVLGKAVAALDVLGQSNLNSISSQN